MLCDKCKKNEANVRVMRNINGAVYEQHLCGECAGLTAESLAAFGGFPRFGDMLSGLKEMSMVNAGMGMTPPEPQQAVGADAFEALGLTLPSFAEERIEEAAKPEAEGESLEELKAELERLVAGEQFEKAAEMRDKIFFMEKERGESK